MKYTPYLSLFLLSPFIFSQKIPGFLNLLNIGQWFKLPETIRDEYDFIIVGSGSAGSVIANRLSEVSDWQILLLEVGDVANPLTAVPMIVALWQLTDLNWGYLMEHQKNVALGCVDERMPWPRGKALGGTSVINYMIYTRGNGLYYDKWAKAGNPGWSYEDVLPYFIKSENSHLTYNVNPQFHGENGSLSIEEAYHAEIFTAFNDGMNELEIPTVDYNSDITRAVSTVQATLSNGRRNSVAEAFLKPVIDRPNLHILTQAFVTKILIDPKTKQAYGVEYERFGKKYNVTASKEVILSAGTFMSAQLLMLSGIGPQTHLQEMEIPILKNLPVGQNLQDHLTYLGLTFSTDQDVTTKLSDFLNPLNQLKYLSRGKGPFGCLGGVQGIAYIRTNEAEGPKGMPDMELLFLGLTLAVDFGLVVRKGMGLTDEMYNAVYGPFESKDGFMIFPMHIDPKSKGYLKLRSKNPHDSPLFYGNFFTDPKNKDVKSFLAAIRFIQKLGETEAFKKFNATFNAYRVPGCEDHVYDSDAYWKCCLTYLAQTLHHQVGTVKMGPKKDPEAVVDNKLRVYGIRKLRVADCSVIPFSVGAHTNTPAIMIGEKAADIIKHAWKK